MTDLKVPAEETPEGQKIIRAMARLIYGNEYSEEFDDLYPEDQEFALEGAARVFRAGYRLP